MDCDFLVGDGTMLNLVILALGVGVVGDVMSGRGGQRCEGGPGGGGSEAVVYRVEMGRRRGPGLINRT